MRIKCLSVRLESLVPISDKAYKATAFDGSTAIIPKSQVLGVDYSVIKSDAYWIAAWILERAPGFQYSSKKVAYFSENGKQLPNIQIEKHTPTRIEPIKPKADESLTR